MKYCYSIFLIACLMFANSLSAQTDIDDDDFSDIYDADTLVTVSVDDPVVDSILVANAAAEPANMRTYIVERGESWESIAEDNGVTVDELRNANRGLPEPFTGMEINVPKKLSDADLQQRRMLLRNAVYAQADQDLSAGNYKDAIKAFDKIIEAGNAPLIVYFKRGSAHYERGKLTAAWRDFNYVEDHDTKGEFEDIGKLCDTLSELIEQKRAANAQMWAGLINTGLQVANSVMQAKQAEKQQSGSYPANGDINSLLDPNLAIQQVNAQNESEYQQLRAVNPSLTREQYMRMKAAAYEATKQAERSRGAYGSSNYSLSSSEHSVESSTTKSHDCPSLKANRKYYCANTGKCGMCGGDGLDDAGFGNGVNNQKCTLCGGTGKCKWCQ